MTTAHYIISFAKYERLERQAKQNIHAILETKAFVESILLISSAALRFLKIGLVFSQRSAKITRQVKRWLLKRTITGNQSVI